MSNNHPLIRYKHISPIKMGVKGELSYIQEELDELTDAHKQNCKLWEIIEGADVILALDKFLWRKHHIPLILVILLAYIRFIYKPIRNKILDLCQVDKKKCLSGLTSAESVVSYRDEVSNYTRHP